MILSTLLSLTPLLQDQLPIRPGLGISGTPTVELAFNRLYDTTDLYGHFDSLVAAWPELFSGETIGTSVGGRELRVYTLNDPASGEPGTKPAMWIDANVHGNEVQGGETILYLAWYVLESRGSNERIDDLLANVTFYMCPSVNPDGRDHWFAAANGASSSRSGISPIDSDQDGLFDEDPTNDLDGDGHVGQMRKYTPGEGTHRLNPDDPRIMEFVGRRAPRGPGDWIMLGSEGIDDDGDGRKNEDGVGGYDMNRSWPSSWQPGHVQFGAGPYPLYWPETRAVADFLMAHPEVAAVQSFHNSGGMILRGPGDSGFGNYPGADLRVYDQLGEEGEKMLPFYNYWVIWSDLYTVFGGFVNWAYEGLGIIAFTNEQWTDDRISPDDRLDDETSARHWFSDQLLMGAGFKDWKPYDHPLYGEVEIGGFVKDLGRVPPAFMIEEESHRNAMFCLIHAEATPRVEIEVARVEEIGGGVFAVDVKFENTRAIPTRTARASQRKIGLPDQITFAGESIEVLAVGERTDRFQPEELDLDEGADPSRIARERGLFDGEPLELRYFVRGSGAFTVAFQSEKAGTHTVTGDLAQ